MTINNTFSNQNQEENNTFSKTNSQDLTEQWRIGELKTGWYYVKNEFGNIFVSEYYKGYDHINERIEKDFFTEVLDITEILAPVPSYEEWQGLNKDIDTMTELWKNERSQLNEKIQLIGKLSVQAVDLKNEIKQLKELLKECNLLLIKQQANDEVEHKESAELVLRIEEVLK
jgi:hypothetical protein